MELNRRQVLMAAAAGARPDDEAYRAKVAAQYDVIGDIIQLENGNWGMVARPVLDHYEAAVRRVNRATSYYARRGLFPDLLAVRARVAAKLGVAGEDIAFTRNATEAPKTLDRGHAVTAVEPSANMRAIGQQLHRDPRIVWVNDSLPLLSRLGAEQYDLIALSAVWMHIPPRNRAASMRRLSHLLAPHGSIYVTLRLGAADRERSIHGVSFQEIETLASRYKLKARILGESPDLLSRSSIRWQRVMLIREPASL